MTQLALSTSQLKRQLHANGYSLTRQRRAVFEVLEKGPASNTTLAKAVAGKVDRASVYRTIELFENINVVQRVWHGRQSQVKLSEIYDAHQHHAKCIRCGKFIPFRSNGLEKAIESAAAEIQFDAYEHSISFVGICKECKA